VAVTCVTVQCGSDGCTADEGCRFRGLHGEEPEYRHINLHQLEIAYYKLRKCCEMLGSDSGGEMLGSDSGGEMLGSDSGGEMLGSDSGVADDSVVTTSYLPAERIVNPVSCMSLYYKGLYRRKLLMQHSMVAYDNMALEMRFDKPVGSEGCR